MYKQVVLNVLLMWPPSYIKLHPMWLACRYKKMKVQKLNQHTSVGYDLRKMRRCCQAGGAEEVTN